MSTNNTTVDLAFAMDCTGSMGSYITSAKDNIRAIVDEIISKESITIRLALIEYRDHPPQETTFVTRVHNFTNSVIEMKGWLEQCTAQGGGDTPEAVADALNDALNLSWVSDAAKICILISDAPPHGLHPAGDSFPSGCPAGFDPLTIARQMNAKTITLYTVGVEPPIVPYREFFMALAHITGGQYVPMVDAAKLAQMIIAGVREEISITALVNSCKKDIAHEVRKATKEGTDDESTAKRLQHLFSQKNLSVNRMKNTNGTPSKKAEECYAKCLDMADMQKQYEKIESNTTTLPAQQDYNLEEKTSVSLEQAKRIVQKAKNWDYTTTDKSETEERVMCRYGDKCHDYSDPHRNKYFHHENNILTTRHERKSNQWESDGHHRDIDRFSSNTHRTPCKYGESCYDHSKQHRAQFSHKATASFDRDTNHFQNDSSLTPCKYGTRCHDSTEHHRRKYSHPTNSAISTPCKYGGSCHNYSDYHRSKYSHP